MNCYTNPHNPHKIKRKSEPEPEPMKTTELADRVGIGVSHMSLILNGKRMPSLSVAQKMARVMGITLEDLCRQIKAA